MNMISLDIDFRWEPVLENVSEPYVFPNKISDHMKRRYKSPAVYRWLVSQNGKIESIYIGEAEMLCPRRIYHYLHPGPSQMTNIRINSLFTKLIHEGKQVTLEKLVFEDFLLDGKTISMSDLGKKTMRVFLEHLMLVHYENKGQKILNMAIK